VIIIKISLYTHPYGKVLYTHKTSAPPHICSSSAPAHPLGQAVQWRSGAEERGPIASGEGAGGPWFWREECTATAKDDRQCNMISTPHRIHRIIYSGWQWVATNNASAVLIFISFFYKVYALGMLLDEWYGGHYNISFYRLNCLHRSTKRKYRVCTVQ
jgi:hypothetical protein